MRNRALIIAAPFGYGPAARALLIANVLADVAEITVLSSRDAFRFIHRHRAASVACIDGVFSRLFRTAESLAPFDTFISINNDPAIHHLIRLGMAQKAIFVDSILPWRAMQGAGGFRQPIRAYLVQDFPGASKLLHTCAALRVELTAPIVWPLEAVPADGLARAPDLPGLKRLTLHLGGVTSPLVAWETVRRPIEAMVSLVGDLARRHERALIVLGNPILATIPALSSAPRNADFRLVPEAGPPEAAAAVGNSELLVTTPGIDMVYEAIAREVPTLLLPPVNSTQLHHYAMLTAAGYPGSMSEATGARLSDRTSGTPWDRQTGFVIRWLHENLSEALAELPARLERMLADDVDAAAARAELLRRQIRFRESLSETSALDLLRTLVVSDTKRRSRSGSGT